MGRERDAWGERSKPTQLPHAVFDSINTARVALVSLLLRRYQGTPDTIRYRIMHLNFKSMGLGSLSRLDITAVRVTTYDLGLDVLFIILKAMEFQNAELTV